MKKKLLIAGGDMRQLYCAAKLSEKYDTDIIGFDENFIPSDIDLPLSSSDNYDALILPVLPVDENGFLSAPCCEEKFTMEKISKLIKPDSAVFAGKVSGSLRNFFPENEIIDYMEREELNILNAIPSAEGALQIALEELPVMLNGLNVLIVGCGRIGSALINILKGFGCRVTVAVRNAKGAAKVKLLGANSCCTKDIDSNYELVFNTVPSMIFDHDLLKKFSRSTLFIDLASKPGGIDFESAAELGIKAIWALGIPGKTAPITAGEIIANTISGILSEKGGESDG